MMHETVPSLTARKKLRTPVLGAMLPPHERTEGAGNVSTRGTTLLARAGQESLSCISRLL